MKIGLTYDLRDAYLAMGYSEEQTAEFDRGETIEGIAGALKSLGYTVDRIGTVRELTARLANGDRWDLVFNIAEGMHGRAREAQVPALLDAYDIPYTFSDALVCAVSLHKPLAKVAAEHLGVATPAFRVISTAAEAAAIDLPYPLFVKPVAEGTSKGIGACSVVASAAQLAPLTARLMGEYKQPLLAETYLGGRELTVGIVGTGETAEVVGVLEVLFRKGRTNVYSYTHKELWQRYIDYQLAGDLAAQQAQEMALTIWRGFGCRDAGRVDFRLDSRGKVHFLEVNPLPGLHPTHSDLPILWMQTGRPYRELIRTIIDSARARIMSPDSSLSILESVNGQAGA